MIKHHGVQYNILYYVINNKSVVSFVQFCRLNCSECHSLGHFVDDGRPYDGTQNTDAGLSAVDNCSVCPVTDGTSCTEPKIRPGRLAGPGRIFCLTGRVSTGRAGFQPTPKTNELWGWSLRLVHTDISDFLPFPLQFTSFLHIPSFSFITAAVILSQVRNVFYAPPATFSYLSD